MKNINELVVADLVEAVKDLARDNPNKTVPPEGCVYFDDHGWPSCLIGHGLAALGVTPDTIVGRGTLREFNGATVAGILLGEALCGKSLTWLRDVQENQDEGLCWETAVELATGKDNS